MSLKIAGASRAPDEKSPSHWSRRHLIRIGAATLAAAGASATGLLGHGAGVAVATSEPHTQSIAPQLSGGLPAAPVEPRAGTWKTWVLTSGSQVRLAAPPDRAETKAELFLLHILAANRSAAALDQIDYWNTGSPAYRWNELAIEHGLTNTIDNLVFSRIIASLNVAIYDALVAAWDSKYTYKRLRPSEADPSLETVVPAPHSPSYPSEQAVVAGAASTMLAYFFPKDAATFIAQAELAGRAAIMAGLQYPSDVSAGYALGQEVAELVIKRAKTDGTDVAWAGSVPTEAGHWTGTNPVGVMGGTWKPWVLTAGSEFRPGPPPAYNSAQMAAELAALKSFTRTPKSNAAAFFWQFSQLGSFPNNRFWMDQLNHRLFEHRLDTNPPRASRAYALASIAMYDSTIAVFDAKYAYWSIRPFQLDPTFTPLFPTPNHPSYPSAHSTISTSITSILGYLFPREAAMYAAMAEAAGISRMWGGIHFQSDIDAGNILGHAVSQPILARAKQDGSQ